MISLFSSILEILIFYIYGCLAIHAFLDDGESDTNAFVLLVLGTFPVCYVVLNIWDSRKDYLVKMKIQDMKNDKDIEHFIYIIIKLIDKREKVDQFIKLQGILKYHRIYCKNENSSCPCENLYKNSNSDEENSSLINDWNNWVKFIITEGKIKRFLIKNRT